MVDIALKLTRAEAHLKLRVHHTDTNSTRESVRQRPDDALGVVRQAGMCPVRMSSLSLLLRGGLTLAPSDNTSKEHQTHACVTAPSLERRNALAHGARYVDFVG